MRERIYGNPGKVITYRIAYDPGLYTRGANGDLSAVDTCRQVVRIVEVKLDRQGVGVGDLDEEDRHHTSLTDRQNERDEKRIDERGITHDEAGLLRVTDAALTAVQSVAQSYSDDLKAASADGKLTAEECQAARDQALQRMKHLLGEAGLSEVQRIFGVYGASLDSALLDRIEAALKGLGK